jgi:rubrerythrin
MNDTVVTQLHRTLVDALRRSRPGALHRPITVAEIYQDILPYRDARNTVGFELNADYEHALLRLLAGEGDLARIEPREVRDKLRMELDSPNPDVGLFRNYAACDVWVSIDPSEDPDADVVVEEMEGANTWEDEFLHEGEDEGEEEDIYELVLEAEPHAPARFEIAADPVPEEEATSPRSDAFPDPGTVPCAFCSGDMPADRMVNFCPFCGTDQSQQPCPSCGEMLDPLWRFCVACGIRVRTLGDHVN